MRGQRVRLAQYAGLQFTGVRLTDLALRLVEISVRLLAMWLIMMVP